MLSKTFNQGSKHTLRHWKNDIWCKNFEGPIHYYKSWLFKRFNLVKMSTLTKRMFAFTKGMGHEKHMIFFIKGSKYNKMTHTCLVWGVVGKDSRNFCNCIVTWHLGLSWSWSMNFEFVRKNQLSLGFINVWLTCV